MRRLIALVVCCLGLCMNGASPVMAADDSQIPDFAGATGWINSEPLTPGALQGKVVLIDFWDYTCINCLRTIPYLTEWYRRYRDDGFIIIGIHTPEFRFAGDRLNATAAMRRLGVSWPVALDGERVLWTRYRNTIWPHEYLFDQRGRLVEHVEGEGNYQQTEAKIQELLRRANPASRFPPVMALLPQDSYAKPGAVCYPRTPEVLIGPSLSSHGSLSRDTRTFRDDGREDEGGVYLQGRWGASSEALISADPGSAVRIPYRAIQVVAVLRRDDSAAIRVDVRQDGRAIAREDAGADVRFDTKGDSYITVDAPRAYDIIMNKHWGKHDLSLTTERAGLNVYSFDFEACEAGADK